MSADELIARVRDDDVIREHVSALVRVRCDADRAKFEDLVYILVALALGTGKKDAWTEALETLEAKSL